MKKFTKEYFLGVFGSISSSARFVFQRGEKVETVLTNFLGILLSELMERPCMFGTTLILANSNLVGVTELGTRTLI